MNSGRDEGPYCSEIKLPLRNDVPFDMQNHRNEYHLTNVACVVKITSPRWTLAFLSESACLCDEVEISVSHLRFAKMLTTDN